jgi:hypothetical protein
MRPCWHDEGVCFRRRPFTAAGHLKAFVEVFWSETTVRSILAGLTVPWQVSSNGCLQVVWSPPTLGTISSDIRAVG